MPSAKCGQTRFGGWEFGPTRDMRKAFGHVEGRGWWWLSVEVTHRTPRHCPFPVPLNMMAI